MFLGSVIYVLVGMLNPIAYTSSIDYWLYRDQLSSIPIPSLVSPVVEMEWVISDEFGTLVFLCGSHQNENSKFWLTLCGSEQQGFGVCCGMNIYMLYICHNLLLYTMYNLLLYTTYICDKFALYMIESLNLNWL